MKKVFYEDKLSGKKQSFPLFAEKDLTFLKNKVLQTEQEKPLVSLSITHSFD